MQKVGDSLGALYQFENKEQGKHWRLVEDKISKIVMLKSGTKYYTKARFRPLDVEEVDYNTELQEEADGYVLTKEVFCLNDNTRPKVEAWVEWANLNKDKALSIFELHNKQ